MQNFKKIVISTLAVGILFSSPAVSGEVTLNVPHYTQYSPYKCGAAVARMWIAYLKGSVISEWAFPRGMSARTLKYYLYHNTGKHFQYHNVSKREAEKYIHHELRKQNRPMAIAAATRYNNGSSKPGQHWLLIVGAKTHNDKHYGRKTDWVQIHDPLYGSRHTGYKTIRTWEHVDRKKLYEKIWLKIGRGSHKFRQLVED